MKIRNGFVSNSSSSSFYIKNKTNSIKTLEDFANETSYLVEDFNEYYSWENRTVEDFMRGCDRGIVWEPKEGKSISFGDEDGDTMGAIYDYMLRDKNETDSFSWYQDGSLR